MVRNKKTAFSTVLIGALILLMTPISALAYVFTMETDDWLFRLSEPDVYWADTSFNRIWLSSDPLPDILLEDKKALMSEDGFFRTDAHPPLESCPFAGEITQVVMRILIHDTYNPTAAGVDMRIAQMDLYFDDGNNAWQPYPDNDVHWPNRWLIVVENSTLQNGDLEWETWPEVQLEAGTAVSMSLDRGTPVPVPSSVWLLNSGLIGLVGFRRKFKKA